MSDLERRVAALEERVALLEGGPVASSGSRSNLRTAGASSSAPAAKVRAPLKKSPSGTSGPKKEKKASNEDSVGVDGAGGGGDSNIDPARVGSYHVGKRKVYYVKPASFEESKTDGSAPRQSLKLEYVFGYNGRDGRHNAFYVQNGAKIVYSIAGTGVLFDLKSQSQSHFTGHDEDILSLHVHPSKPIAATGQLDPKGSGKPYICIWNYESMQLLKKIQNFHDRGVPVVQFSPDGKYLVTIGNDDSHTVAVWDWENDVKTPAAWTTGNKDDTFGACFNPASEAGNPEFAVFGKKFLKVFTMVEKAKNAKKKGEPAFELKQNAASYYNETKKSVDAWHTAVYLSDGTLVAGAKSGEIFTFKGTKLGVVLEVHSKAVGAICVTQNGFASAGSDGLLLQWRRNDKTFDVASKHDLSADHKEPVFPRNLDTVKGKFLLGTSHNQLFEVDGSNGKSKLLVDGHHNEIWGLAVHPKGRLFASSGHDAVLRVWDIERRATVHQHAFSSESKKGAEAVRSAAYSPDGSLIAVGMLSGKVAILKSDTLEVTWEKKVAKEQVDAIAFSPNGQLIGLGSWDQSAYLVDLESKSSVTLKGHTSSITHLTFSADSRVLQTNSRDYEILYWNVETGKRLERNETADVVWHDWQCIMGWPVRGIFSGDMDGTDVNACNISGNEGDSDRLVATGDDFGKVTIFRYPCCTKDPEKKQYMGHCSHVTNVRFTRDGKHLISAGGNDCSVFLWRVVD